MAWLTALQYAFYAAGTLGAVDQMLTDPPQNTLATTGQASGGVSNPQAQQIFAQGQPQPKAQAVPNAVQPPVDPNVTAQTNALATPPSSVGQSIVDNALTSGQPLNVPNSPLTQAAGGPAPNPAAADASGLGQFLAGLNNSGKALAAMAPLLGLGEKEARTRAMAGAAGGGAGGQNIFQLPQRNTLAQILASLPRTYNG